MTFLPIAVRELRVAARKRNTFWVRTIAGCAAMLIAAAFMLMMSLAPGPGAARMGEILFTVLTWMALAGVLSAGLFFTSDSLSEEKREGTIGFLFLTDLRGYDVVSGKILATSLRAFYGLLALFPILAVTLLMGGVTGTQLLKTSLALVNALIGSLAAGIFISSISRDAQRAIGGTLCLFAAVIFGGPVLDGWLTARFNRPPGILSATSPAYAFMLAGQWGRNAYWWSLLTSQVIAWLMVAAACVLVPRTWQQKSRGTGQLGRERLYAIKYGTASRRTRLRRKLLALDPIVWLACRERWQGLGLWLLTLAVLGGFVAVLLLAPLAYRMGWSYLSGMLSLALYLGAATQASRFFIDVRKSGLLELLLSAPLDDRQIMSGQVRALLRTFGLPLLIILLVQLVAGWVSHESWRSLGVQAPDWWVMILSGVLAAVTTAANLVAICFFGMWMGVTSKSTNWATLKTLLLVQVVPWMVIMFASWIATWGILLPAFVKAGAGGGTTANMIVWYPLIFAALTALLSLGKDVGFFFWAYHRLTTSLREQASRGLGPVTVAPVSFPPVVPPPIVAPSSNP